MEFRTEGNAAKSSRPHRSMLCGFTLVELLVVIVIIAILAAIIYPVISRVQENGRQSSSISNMHDISAKLGEYILDKHQPPSVLFGYVYHDPITNALVPMDQVLTNIQSQPNADVLLGTFLPGLYPAYINNVAEFTDPNNHAKYSAVDFPDVNILCPSTNAACSAAAPGTLVTLTGAAAPGFYAADSYDSSPQILGPNAIASTLTGTGYVTRYQSAWTSVTTNGFPDKTWWPGADYSAPPAGAPDYTVGTGNLWATIPTGVDNPGQVYERQMHWQYPPATSYVTATTYHVPNTNSVLVLFEDGSVRKFTSEQFTIRNGGDPSTIGTVVSGAGAPASSANFWQLLPTGQ